MTDKLFVHELTRTLVEVELRDTGYPGSSYTLLFDPDQDALIGFYFQAVQQQYVDVIFLRMKKKPGLWFTLETVDGQLSVVCPRIRESEIRGKIKSFHAIGFAPTAELKASAIPQKRK